MIGEHLSPMFEDNYITQEQYKRILQMRWSSLKDDRDLAKALILSLRRQQLKELILQLSPHNFSVLQGMSWYLTAGEAEVTDCDKFTSADQIAEFIIEPRLAWAIKECKQMLGHKYEHQTQHLKNSDQFTEITHSSDDL